MVDASIRESRTIPAMFFNRVRISADHIAYEYRAGEDWLAVTYRAYGDLVTRTALSLRELGIGVGDCVAIWGETTPEWTLLDLGALSVGAQVAGVYQTCAPDQAAYILKDSCARVLCVDSPARLESALSIRTETPRIEFYVLWSGTPITTPNGPVVKPFQTLLERGSVLQAENPEAGAQLVAAVTPESHAVLVYTSGTTGLPKAVILTHANCMSNCKNIMEGHEFVEHKDSLVAFLPMSHVAEHTCNFLGRLYGGISAYFCPDFQRVGQVMKEKSPTLLTGVPRLYEKMYQRIQSVIDASPPRRQRLIGWALDTGKAVADLEEFDRPVPVGLRMRHAIADRIVLSKIRAHVGGRLRAVTCGAAPIDTEIVDFFRSLGIVFLEAYGLSECGGVSHINRAHAYRVGTVGRAIDGTECQIAEDGEVLLRSEGVFKGYLRNPEATAEMIDPEGWLHTGDIGEIDPEGYLRITDRKKNLIITAGGKNVAPAGIELLIKRDPLVSQVVVFGDRKPYLVGLIALAPDLVEAEKPSEEEIQERVGRVIDEANLHLARYEQIKKFAVVPHEFTIEEGEMTPTMKIKRNVVAQHYAHLIAEMYGEAPVDVSTS